MSRLSIFACFLFLSSCASVPENFGPPSPSSKIGLYLLIDERPKHEHVGTTSFQNFELTAASESNFRDRYYRQIVEVLSVKEYEVDLLPQSSQLVEKRLTLFTYASGNIHFKNDVKEIFNKVATERGLDYVIIVYPVSGPAWPNSSVYINGYGLYTRCMLGDCAAEALDYVSARIYDVKNQSSLKPMGFNIYERPSLSLIGPSEGIDKISPQDVDRAADQALDKFMKLFSAMVKTSGFVE